MREKEKNVLMIKITCQCHRTMIVTIVNNQIVKYHLHLLKYIKRRGKSADLLGRNS